MAFVLVNSSGFYLQTIYFSYNFFFKWVCHFQSQIEVENKLKMYLKCGVF
jgi:hypothetical protein